MNRAAKAVGRRANRYRAYKLALEIMRKSDPDMAALTTAQRQAVKKAAGKASNKIALEISVEQEGTGGGKSAGTGES